MGEVRRQIERFPQDRMDWHYGLFRPAEKGRLFGTQCSNAGVFQGKGPQEPAAIRTVRTLHERSARLLVRVFR